LFDEKTKKKKNNMYLDDSIDKSPKLIPQNEFERNSIRNPLSKDSLGEEEMKNSLRAPLLEDNIIEDNKLFHYNVKKKKNFFILFYFYVYFILLFIFITPTHTQNRVGMKNFKDYWMKVEITEKI